MINVGIDVYVRNCFVHGRDGSGRTMVNTHATCYQKMEG